MFEGFTVHAVTPFGLIVIILASHGCVKLLAATGAPHDPFSRGGCQYRVASHSGRAVEPAQGRASRALYLIIRAWSGRANLLSRIVLSCA